MSGPMRTLRTLLPATALAAGLAVGASANATIFIGVSTDNGATITIVATDPTNTNAAVSGQAYGTFKINNISATGDVALPDLLSSNSLNTSSTSAGTLDVYILETDLLASSDTGGFISSLTSNKLTGGLSVTESIFFDALDTSVVSAGVGEGSHLFTTIGTSVISHAAHPAGLYALTEQYHMVSTGSGTANSTIDVTSVPEPATWGLMLVGFGGLGAMLRSNRRRNVALTA
jgi:hypothetical protein